MTEKKKAVQYILFVLMVCSLLVLPAAADTLDDAGADLPGSGMNGTVDTETTPTETPTAVPMDEATATPTESPASSPMQAGIMGTGPVSLFDGSVTLPLGAFPQEAYNSGKSHAVMNPTPLGVLHAVAESEGWVYNVTDKKYADMGFFLLDSVSSYQKGDEKWSCYVNDVLRDGFSNSDDGLNVLQLNDNDKVTFCYGANSDLDSATAIINATVDLDEDDWTLALIGARRRYDLA